MAVIAAIVLVAILSACSSEEAAAPEIEQEIVDVPGFDFQLPCPVVPLFPDYLFASGTARDGIPSIDAPTFTTAGEASWLNDDDRVIGVLFDGEAIAIPIRIMVWHEVVNLTGSTGRATVTYCPLTFTGIAFDLEGEFPGQNQTTGVSGLLYNSNLVLYDRRTESLWTQMSGSAYSGPAAGDCLDIIPTVDTSFGFWKKLQPATRVLKRPGKASNYAKYDLNPYTTYWANDEVLYPVPDPLDGRLGTKSWVLGVLTDTAAKAYPILNVHVVNDELPGVPYVVFNARGENTMVAFKAWVVDGEALTFTFADMRAGVPTYTDDRTGSTWNFNGVCIEGALEGSTLERMPSYLAFYFAWSSFFPDTEVHTAPE